MRIIRCLEKPSLKCKPCRGDKVDTIIDGITTLARVQKRIHQNSIGLQIRCEFEMLCTGWSRDSSEIVSLAV